MSTELKNIGCDQATPHGVGPATCTGMAEHVEQCAGCVKLRDAGPLDGMEVAVLRRMVLSYQDDLRAIREIVEQYMGPTRHDSPPLVDRLKEAIAVAVAAGRIAT